MSEFLLESDIIKFNKDIMTIKRLYTKMCKLMYKYVNKPDEVVRDYELSDDMKTIINRLKKDDRLDKVINHSSGGLLHVLINNYNYNLHYKKYYNEIKLMKMICLLLDSGASLSQKSIKYKKTVLEKCDRITKNIIEQWKVNHINQLIKDLCYNISNLEIKEFNNILDSETCYIPDLIKNESNILNHVILRYNSVKDDLVDKKFNEDDYYDRYYLTNHKDMMCKLLRLGFKVSIKDIDEYNLQIIEDCNVECYESG